MVRKIGEDCICHNLTYLFRTTNNQYRVKGPRNLLKRITPSELYHNYTTTKSPNPDPSQKRTDELSYISLTVNEEETAEAGL